MPGDLLYKVGTIATITSSQSSLATDVAVATASDLDTRSGGTSGTVENMLFRAELTVQWATITSIDPGETAAEFYLVPALDGTNFPAVKTASVAFISPTYLAGYFVTSVAPTANTDALLATAVFSLPPGLYRPYLVNRSGQTMSASWTLKVMSWRGQYT